MHSYTETVSNDCFVRLFRPFFFNDGGGSEKDFAKEATQNCGNADKMEKKKRFETSCYLCVRGHSEGSFKFTNELAA